MIEIDETQNKAINKTLTIKNIYRILFSLYEKFLNFKEKSFILDTKRTLKKIVMKNKT